MFKNYFYSGCVYSEWMEWSQCSKTCDNGYQFRKRVKTPGKGSEPCNQSVRDLNDCNISPCLGKYI